jgi:CDP-diacylglycerol--serine O-phosphatidyltransferase
MPRLKPGRGLKELPLNRLLPNMLTVVALCSGLTAIRFAMQERWEAAALAIVVAAVIDGLDGRLARLLHAQSKFGAELDSLADVVSFGVAPALTLYLWALNGTGLFGWLCALFFAVCSALRLARFNTLAAQPEEPSHKNNVFIGVPTPAGAGLALMPMMLTFELGPGFWGNAWLVGLWTAVVGGLMFSTLPTFSLKRIRIPQAAVPFLLVGVGVVATALATNTWAALVWLGFAYILSLPVSVWWVKRKLAAAAAAPTVMGAGKDGAAKDGGAKDEAAEDAIPPFIHIDENDEDRPPSSRLQ